MKRDFDVERCAPLTSPCVGLRYTCRLQSQHPSLTLLLSPLDCQVRTCVSYPLSVRVFRFVAAIGRLRAAPKSRQLSPPVPPLLPLSDLLFMKYKMRSAIVITALIFSLVVLSRADSGTSTSLHPAEQQQQQPDIPLSSSLAPFASPLSIVMYDSGVQ